MNINIEISQVPERLELVKKKFNLSNRQLSVHAKVSSTNIGDIISGKNTNPKFETFYNIAESLGISLDWLARGEGEMLTIKKSNDKSLDNGAFGNEVIEKILQEMKAQYEARIEELKQYNQLLLDQLKFNKEMVQDFKEGRLGKFEGAPKGQLAYNQLLAQTNGWSLYR